MSCKKCKRNDVRRDEDTGKLICASCGEVQALESFEHSALASQLGVFVAVGTSGVGSSLNFRDKTKYEANKVIDDICLKLKLTGSKPSELKSMISKITEDRFGRGNWFVTLIGACAYVIMRGGDKPLSIIEVAGTVQCDGYALGRMVYRVLEFLEIKLPSFDFVKSFERVLSKAYEYGKIGKDHAQRVREQGVFLMNCAVKWSLSTGRQPLQLIVAVLVFVAEINGLQGLRIDEVARDVGVSLQTCKKRYKELLERLVEVAKVGLPWGRDVTVKNVVKNGAFLLKYMEMKAEAERGSAVEQLNTKDSIVECLREHEMYSFSVDENDSSYFRVSDNDEGVGSFRTQTGDQLQLSLECLLFVRKKLSVKSETRLENMEKVKEVTKTLLNPMDWWHGKSALSKKILLDQLLEKNIGPDFLPPSFVEGCRHVEKRRERIRAAKARIAKIVQPAISDDSVRENHLTHLKMKKRKRQLVKKDFDWEDFTIETLLLHHVNEEQIEMGHYRTLLDLHVFNSGLL